MRATLLALQVLGGLESEDIRPEMLNYIPSNGYKGAAKFVMVDDGFLSIYDRAKYGLLPGVGANIRGTLNGSEGPVVELPTQFEIAYKWACLKDGVKTLMGGKVYTPHHKAAQDGKLALVDHSYYGLYRERIKFVNSKMEPVQLPMISDMDYLLEVVKGIVALNRKDYGYVGGSERLNAFIDTVFYAKIDGYFYVLYCLYRLLDNTLISQQSPYELEQHFKWICQQVSTKPQDFFYKNFDPRSSSDRKKIAKVFSKHRGEAKSVLLYGIAMADSIDHTFLRARGQFGHVSNAARVLRFLEARDSLELSLDYDTRKENYV